MKNTKTYRSKAAGFVLDNPHTRPDIGMDAIENLFNDTRLEPDDTPSAEAPEKRMRYFQRARLKNLPSRKGKFFKNVRIKLNQVAVEQKKPRQGKYFFAK